METVTGLDMGIDPYCHTSAVYGDCSTTIAVATEPCVPCMHDCCNHPCPISMHACMHALLQSSTSPYHPHSRYDRHHDPHRQSFVLRLGLHAVHQLDPVMMHVYGCMTSFVPRLLFTQRMNSIQSLRCTCVHLRERPLQSRAMAH